MEVHPNPEKAKSDGPNMLKLSQLPELLKQIKTLDSAVRSQT
jgi:2-dehydro-3-deoxyphosphooctonate aldolase (KDO 8-P synthase)